MFLLIDNYDSFTYNLVHYLGELGIEVVVRRNDAISVDDAVTMAPEAIVISPGPGVPDDTGICLDLVARAANANLPVFGVCLGHQSIARAFGATIVRAQRIMHGKTSAIHHDGRGIFQGLPSPLEAIRYHSLAVYREGLPDSLEVTAWTDSGLIMGLRHKEYPIEGIQFHPESIMTETGKDILRNFLNMPARRAVEAG